MAGNYRWAKRVAVASMVVLLAGCGTDPGGGRPATTTTTPQAGSRAQAEVFARQLLARFAVPSGARPVRLSPVPISAVVYGAKLYRVKGTFRSAADIAALAGLLNGLPAAPDTTQSCPVSNTFQIGFDPRTAGPAEVVVTTYGCYGATVTSGGIPQPALLDSGNAAAAAAARMLGISAG